jgi:SAM-dependent methyltransferase
MIDDVASFVGSIPEHYDYGLGPVLFAPYASDLAARVAACEPLLVLETAAGTGIVTRQLRDALPAAAQIIATDLNSAMLDVARTKFRPGEAVEFRPADATALPFGDGSFAVVACQFGVMFFPNKAQSYREAWRVLRPGGHYIFSVWDSLAHNPFARIAHQVAAGFFPNDPPQFYQVPFGYYQIDPLKDALLDAGFAELHVHLVTFQQTIADVAAFARGLVFGNPLVDQIRQRGGVDPGRVVDALADAMCQAFGAKPGRMALQAIVVEAARLKG